MAESVTLRKELKERFGQELNPAEKLFFLEAASEALHQRGYQAGEDLFYYCYFLTQRERLRGIGLQSREGYLRYLLVEGMKDIEDMIKIYEERLERSKLPMPDPKAHQFLAHFTMKEAS